MVTDGPVRQLAPVVSVAVDGRRVAVTAWSDLGGRHVAALRRALAAAVRRGGRQVDVDLSRATQLDCRVLDVVDAARRLVGMLDGGVELRGVAEQAVVHRCGQVHRAA